MSKATCGACMKPYDLSRQSQICPHPRRPPRTQTARLVDYLRHHPRASSLEVTLDLGIVNVTGRVSDARAQGIKVVCETRDDGNKGYRIVEPEPVQVSLFFAELGV